MLDPDVHALWLEAARRGHPPSVREVAEKQYNLVTSWHHEEAFYNLPAKIDPNSPIKTKVFREMTRNGSKSTSIFVLRLYIAEYLAPFWRRTGLPLQKVNRHLVIFGRDQNHLRDEIFKPLKDFITDNAPWLRSKNWEEMVEDRDDPQDEGFRKIADMKSKGAQKWEAYRIDLSNGITIKSRTMRQSPRNLHVFYADFDDILTEENVAQSAEMLEKIDSALMPAIEPGGLVLYAATPQAPGDLGDMLLGRTDWDRMQHPAQDLGQLQVGGLPLDYAAKNREWLGPSSALLEDDHLRCIWPARISPTYLESERGTTRESEEKFLREYMLDRRPASTALVHNEDIAAARDESLSYHFRSNTSLPAIDGAGNPVMESDPKDPKRMRQAMMPISYYGGVDPSGRRRDEAAFCLGAVTREGIRIPLHFKALAVDRNLAAGEGAMSVVTELNDLVNRFGCYKWMVETNGLQSLIIALQRRLNPSVVCDEFDLNSNKHTERGWKGIRALFSSRMIRLPYRTKEDRAITDEFVQQLRGLQLIDGQVREDPSRKNDRVSAFFLFIKATEGAVGSPVNFSALPLPRGDGPSFSNSPAALVGRPAPARFGDGELGGSKPRIGSLQSIEERLAKWQKRR